MTHKDKVSYASTPPCKCLLNFFWRCHCDCRFTATQYNTPQHTATHRSTDRSTPHHAATQFTTPWRIPRWWEYSTAFSVLTLPLRQPLHCNTLQTLQHTATHWNTLQHTATHCNGLQRTATHCNTLQHTATHYNTLQHTTTHRSTLQHTAPHLWEFRDDEFAKHLLKEFWCCLCNCLYILSRQPHFPYTGN